MYEWKANFNNKITNALYIDICKVLPTANLGPSAASDSPKLSPADAFGNPANSHAVFDALKSQLSADPVAEIV